MNKRTFILPLAAVVLFLLFTTMATSAFSHFSHEPESVISMPSYSPTKADTITEPDESKMMMHNLNEADGYTPSEMSKKSTHATTPKTNRIETEFKNHNL